MKSGIHYANVCNIGHKGAGRFNTHNMCRVVQRSQVGNVFKFGDYTVVHDNRFGKFTAVHDTVAHCADDIYVFNDAVFFIG